jgi:hypothetical protein
MLCTLSVCTKGRKTAQTIAGIKIVSSLLLSASYGTLHCIKLGGCTITGKDADFDKEPLISEGFNNFSAHVNK